ncbi:MAG TPA: hypothetical protein VFY87_11390 [Geminicoccaceae bacterium]|nr:hypothetical protein [Geminicoccaceae bacterium]
MTHPAASSPSSFVVNAPNDAAGTHDERLPVPLAALTVVTLSLVLWAGIGLLLRWLVAG